MAAGAGLLARGGQGHIMKDQLTNTGRCEVLGRRRWFTLLAGTQNECKTGDKNRSHHHSGFRVKV
jgi:hypothetical protein